MEGFSVLVGLEVHEEMKDLKVVEPGEGLVHIKLQKDVLRYGQHIDCILEMRKGPVLFCFVLFVRREA